MQYIYVQNVCKIKKKITTVAAYQLLVSSDSLDDNRKCNHRLSKVDMPIYSRLKIPVSCSSQDILSVEENLKKAKMTVSVYMIKHTLDVHQIVK